MYGNIQRVINTAASKPSGFSPLASRYTKTGAPAIPTTQVTISAMVSKVATELINAWVASSPSFCLLAANTGTKAWLNAPSANMRRSMLGMRNATQKASVIALTPKMDAISKSRTRPVIRDARVSSETMEADLIRLTG